MTVCPRESEVSVHSTTVPPPPEPFALASIDAPSAMVRLLADLRSPLPCQSPPTSTVPPPVAPVALMLLLDARVIVSASKVIRPPCEMMLFASSTPALLTTPPCSWLTPTAEMMICPSGARTASRFSISEAMELGVVVMPARPPCPLKLRVTKSPDARATVPLCATIAPAFWTWGASRAM